MAEIYKLKYRTIIGGRPELSTFFTYEIMCHKGGGGGTKNVDSSHNFFSTNQTTDTKIGVCFAG